jgi:hypothetical protein
MINQNTVSLEDVMTQEIFLNENGKIFINKYWNQLKAPDYDFWDKLQSEIKKDNSGNYFNFFSFKFRQWQDKLIAKIPTTLPWLAWLRRATIYIDKIDKYYLIKNVERINEWRAWLIIEEDLIASDYPLAKEVEGEYWFDTKPLTLKDIDDIDSCVFCPNYSANDTFRKIWGSKKLSISGSYQIHAILEPKDFIELLNKKKSEAVGFLDRQIDYNPYFYAAYLLAGTLQEKREKLSKGKEKQEEIQQEIRNFYKETETDGKVIPRKHPKIKEEWDEDYITVPYDKKTMKDKAKALILLPNKEKLETNNERFVLYDEKYRQHFLTKHFLTKHCSLNINCLGEETRIKKTELLFNNKGVFIDYSLATDIGISWKLKLSTGEEDWERTFLIKEIKEEKKEDSKIGVWFKAITNTIISAASIYFAAQTAGASTVLLGAQAAFTSSQAVSSMRKSVGSWGGVATAYSTQTQINPPLISELSNFVFEKIDKDLISITLEEPVSFHNLYILSINKLIHSNNFDFENDYEMLWKTKEKGTAKDILGKIHGWVKLNNKTLLNVSNNYWLEHIKQNRIFIYKENPPVKTTGDYLNFSIKNDTGIVPLEFEKILGVGTEVPHFEKEIEVDLTSPTEQIPEIFQKPLVRKRELSENIPKLNKEWFEKEKKKQKDKWKKFDSD